MILSEGKRKKKKEEGECGGSTMNSGTRRFYQSNESFQLERGLGVGRRVEYDRTARFIKGRSRAIDSCTSRGAINALDTEGQSLRRGAAIDTFREGSGRGGGWRQEGRKEGRQGCEASHWDKGPITRVTRGLLIAE